MRYVVVGTEEVRTCTKKGSEVVETCSNQGFEVV